MHGGHGNLLTKHVAGTDLAISATCWNGKIIPFRRRRKTMKVNKIDHICIAVKNLDEAKKVWEPIMGKTKADDEYIDEPEKIKVARYWLGEVGFELMESTTPDGDVAKFIEKRGEGVMLISFNVDNTRKSIDELKRQGLSLYPRQDRRDRQTLQGL